MDVKNFLTTKQVAEELGISVAQVCALCQREALSSIRVGRSYLIYPSSVKKYKTSDARKYAPNTKKVGRYFSDKISTR